MMDGFILMLVLKKKKNSLHLMETHTLPAMSSNSPLPTCRVGIQKFHQIVQVIQAVGTKVKTAERRPRRTGPWVTSTALVGWVVGFPGFSWNPHWMVPKIGGFPPNHPILRGFSIIFTIHFGVTLIFGNTLMELWKMTVKPTRSGRLY